MSLLVEKSTGDCSYFGDRTDLGKWRCEADENTCIPFTESCNGTCYTGLEPCGVNTGICIPKFDDDPYWTCDDQCISKSNLCEGKCPEGYDMCGNKCLPSSQMQNYHSCNTRCISKDIYEGFFMMNSDQLHEN